MSTPSTQQFVSGHIALPDVCNLNVIKMVVSTVRCQDVWCFVNLNLTESEYPSMEGRGITLRPVDKVTIKDNTPLLAT